MIPNNAACLSAVPFSDSVPVPPSHRLFTEIKRAAPNSYPHNIEKINRAVFFISFLITTSSSAVKSHHPLIQPPPPPHPQADPVKANFKIYRPGHPVLTKVIVPRPKIMKKQKEWRTQ